MNPTVSTSDILRPSATRATGTRAWVWYAAIALVALVIIVYLTDIFLTKPPTVTPASGTTPPVLQASETFRYDGRVVPDAQATAAHAQVTDAGQIVRVAPTVAPVATTYGTAAALPSGTADVPDVSVAAAATNRVPLPTPAPIDTGAITNGRAHPAGTARGIDVIYGTLPADQNPSLATSISATTTPLLAHATPTPAAAAGLAGPGGDTLPGRRHPPAARYMIAAGSSIDCFTIGYIESDMPGPVACQIAAPVIDALSGVTLIPAGAKVIGYFAGTASTATALTIGWTRIIFPDRSSFDLDKLPALNEDGHMGVSGSYDDHRGKLFRATFIGAILSAIAQRFVGAPASTTNVYVTTGGANGAQPYAASAQMILDLVSQLNARDGQLPPTIVIPENAPVKIYVDRDMLFDGPYVPLAPEGS